MYQPHLRTVATLHWETLNVAWMVWQGTKTDALYLSGCTSLIFVNPGTKIDSCYYRDVVLMQQMLSSIRSIAGDAYVLQQDSAPGYQRIVCVRRSSSFSVKLRNSLLQTYSLQIVLILTQQTIEYELLCRIVLNCLSDASSRRDQSEAALDWHMERTVAECRWWCCQWMAEES